MAGNTNFLVFNEANDVSRTYNDSEYSNATQRANGVIPGMAISRMHNKMYYQWSAMCRAIALWITQAGYNAMDNDINEIVTSLGGVTQAAWYLIRKNSTAYSVGDVAFSPNLPSNLYLVCTTAGTSASSEPSWSGAAEGGTVTDGSVTWQYRSLSTKYAPINSPAFTGTPTAPTQTSTDNSTKLATTAFVKTAVSGISGGFTHRTVLTSSGSYTVPQSGTFLVICIGGGGAGGNGGSTSAGGLSGTAGGTTSFGSYCSASGGASGGGGGQRSSGGGGAAGSIDYAFATLTSGQSISYTVGAGGVAATSGTASGTTGSNGSGGASGGVAYSTAEGGRSNYGSGGAGARYDAGSSSAYFGSQPMGYGGTNGTPYGGGGGGGVTNYCDHLPVCGASGGANGSNSATIYTKDSTYPQGGNGGAGAIILYY